MKFSEIATNATAGREVHCEGGWGYNPFYAKRAGYVTWPNRRMMPRFKKTISKLSRHDIVRHPVFRPFDEDWLFTTNAISPESVEPIRARILADGIPATSFAAGANPIGSGAVAGNIDYETCKSGQWPRRDGRWLHSDIKNVAFIFNHKFFKRLVEGEDR